MKLFLMPLLVFFISITSFTQTIKLEIKTLDFEKGTPITDANIELSKKYFGTTNNLGEFSISDLINGKYSVNISHINYKPFQKELILISDTALIIKLYPTTFKLNDIIVTSSKYEKDINLLPYSVATISDVEIEKKVSVTVPDLLKNEAGISVLNDGIWATDISIRGLNRSNIVTLIDGNRIETSTDISARLSMFNLNDIERIEVIKGAASSLYGSGATGGIVNIISKSGSYNGESTLNGNFSGAFSSVNNLYSSGFTLFASGNDWLTKLSANYRKAGNLKTPSGELQNSQFEDNSFSALFQAKPFQNHEVKFNFQQFNATDVGIPGAAPLFPNKAIVTYPTDQRRLLSAEYKINNLTRSLVKLSAKYFHQYIDRKVENIPGIVQFVSGANGQPPRRVSVLKINPGAQHNVNGFQTQADFSFANNYLIAGFDFWKRNYDGLRSKYQKIEILNPIDSSVVNTLIKNIFEKPLPDADYYSAGFYLQDEFNLSNDFNVTLGSRYDFIWLKNSETLNPLYEINNGVINNTPAGQSTIWNAESAQNKSYVFNIGLLYLLNNNSNISLHIARSFRSPSLEERYQYIDLGSVLRVGNPDLNPENGYFFDLSYKTFPQNFYISTSVFANFLNDLVTEVPGTYENRNALLKTNIGKALLYGFEYSIRFKVIDKLSVYNNLAYVRGIDQKDDLDLPQIPPLNTVLGLEFSPVDWISADISAIIFDKQNKIAIGEIETPGYVTINLRFYFSNIRFGNFKFGLSAGIENILDKEYRNHLSTNRGLIIDEPGRNIFIKTDFAF